MVRERMRRQNSHDRWRGLLHESAQHTAGLAKERDMRSEGNIATQQARVLTAGMAPEGATDYLRSLAADLIRCIAEREWEKQDE